MGQEPAIRLGIVKNLSRQTSGASNNRAASRLVWRQGNSLDPIQLRIDRSEISEVQRLAWVKLFVLVQRQQPLTPIQIAVTQQLPAVLRPDKDIEIGEIIGRIAQRICRIQAERQHDQRCRRAMFARVFPDAARN